MSDENSVIGAIESSASTFCEMVFHHDRRDISNEVVDHDGNVVLAAKNKGFNRQELLRVLYECMTSPGTEALILSPNPAGARGTVLLIEDEFDRSALTESELGVERISETQIKFINGSRILSYAIGNGDEHKVRGYAPDMLVVDLYEEEGFEISDEAIKNVLLPMVSTATVWTLDTEVHNDNLLTRSLLNDGALVKYMYGAD